MSKVTLLREVRLILSAGAAKPGPTIGQALGPLGLNMVEFCKQFNEKTKHMEKDTPIPMKLSAFSNKTFTFVVKSPTTSWFLKKCAGVDKGTGRTGHEFIGEVHVKQVYEIAKLKQTDQHMQQLSLDTISRMIIASASSMGIRIVDDKSPPMTYSRTEIVAPPKADKTATTTTAAGAKTDGKTPAGKGDGKTPAGKGDGKAPAGKGDGKAPAGKGSKKDDSSNDSSDEGSDSKSKSKGKSKSK